MTDTLIHCPNCGAEIPVSEVLAAQLRERVQTELRADYEARLVKERERAASEAREDAELQLREMHQSLEDHQQKAQQSQERELELRRRTRELEDQQQTLAERVRAETEESLRQQQLEQVAKERAAAEQRVREQIQPLLRQLEDDLTAQRRKTAEAQEAELALRKEKAFVEERARELDLEVARKVDAGRAELEDAIRKAAADEQNLKLKEKEKQIADLRRALEDAKRRSEMGSQELQGEVLEMDIQVALERRFPHDRIEPVPKGIRGADIVQRVIDDRGRDCGSIVWETKNTKHWQPAWLDKLKEDQRAVGAALSVLVSVVLPEGIEGFGRIDSVWVSDLRSWPALAVALREQLIQVAFVHVANEGKSEKMEMLYRYLSGDPFRSRVQGIVEAFDAMQQQLARERRAMEKLWREREKQIDRVITNTVGMYGEMTGLIGASMPRIAALDLEAGLLEDPGEEGDT